MATEAGKLESYIQDISRLVETFSGQEQANKQSLQMLAGETPAVFCAAGIHVLAAAPVSPGVRSLVQLLTKSRGLTAGLLDPRTSTVAQAVAACRAAVESGAQLHSALEIALTQALQAPTGSQNSARILRILDLLAASGAQSTWNSFQLELMAYPDKMVRSKAALLIGRNVKNLSWIGRRLMDRDPRVQASAVEALWGNRDPEAQALLSVALKSKNNRVAANAALGLYRISDGRAVPALLEMMRHPDPAFRLSALWAIGQTGDPRFLPALQSQFPTAQGKTRLAIAGAMSHIRRREREAANQEPLEFHAARAIRESDGRRHLTFALSSPRAGDWGGFTRAEFALWENQKLVENYDVQSLANPAVILAGFVTPQGSSVGEPYAEALREGLNLCLARKRPDDLWRIDRYAAESPDSGEPGRGGQPVLPYDDQVVTPELKMRHGCIADLGLLAKAITLATPADRLAPGLLAAIERQSQALAKHSGKRHVFLFLHDMDQELTREPAITKLKSLGQDNGVIFHVLCHDAAASWGPFEELCLSNSDGTFEQATAGTLAVKLAESYARLLNRYEITYSLPASAEAGPVTIKVSGEHGAGQAELSFKPAPPEPPVPPTQIQPEPETEPAQVSSS
ncbi:MAG TPA: HEAT repeat domain-containing protein [Bryobacteraceae bacterium]|nr:HEAT repeat domain-containing protein [Bryobacteraceae bacterium]